MRPSLFVDSDNALGSPFGDVDDGYALAALLSSDEKIAALSTVFGNSFEPWTYQNHLRMASLCGYRGPILRGAATRWSKATESSRFLASLDHSVRALALGPLTNLALALRGNPSAGQNIAEIIFVGTNLSVSLPALRFFDFNQWKDPRALREVLQSGIPLTIVPCDVARRLRVTGAQVAAIEGTLGAYLQAHSRRWFRRASWLKGVTSVPIWDLVAAMYVLEPTLFETRPSTLTLGAFGQSHYDLPQGRPVKLIDGYEPAALWTKFQSLVSKP